MTLIINNQIEIIKDTLSDVDTVQLEKFIDSRYEVGATQEELDFLEEVYSYRVSEENIDMTEDEPMMSEAAGPQGIELEQALIEAYAQYLLDPLDRSGAGRTGLSDEDVIARMRSTLEHIGRMKAGITDHQILDAAKELYVAKRSLIKKQRKKGGG